MSVDFSTDYSNHTLLDNKAKYSKIYKLSEVEASDVEKGDLVLLKTPCGQYRLYMATSSSDEDNTLHLTRYAEVDFIKAGEGNNNDGLIISDSTPCGCI